MSLRICLVLLVLVFLLACAAYVRGGMPYEVHRASGAMSALGADARGLYWLETAGGGGRTQGPGAPKGGDQGTGAAAGGDVGLCVLDGGRGPARRVLAQPGLTAAASTDETLIALQRTGDTGALLQVPRAGGPPATLAQGLAHPVGLVVYEGEAYWTETTPRLIHHARHIPATQARMVVRAVPLDGGGSPRTVAWLRGGTQEFAGELLGGRDGRLYLLEAIGQDCGAGWSNVRSVPTAGGLVETVTHERGPQTARLVGNELYWTGPSEDAGSPSEAHSLRRTALSQANVQTLTDWLPSTGTLCEAGGRVYYGSMGGLWAVPDRRALPRAVMSRPIPNGLVAGYGGAVYVVRAAEEGSVVLQRWPVTLGARLRAGIRIR